MQELLFQAKSVLEKAYSPYSNFRVGAAVRTEDGRVFTGTNVENISYNLSICAERVAIFKAVSEGYRSFTDLAVVSSSRIPTLPCGACRQVMHEFSPRMIIHFENNDKKSLKDLLPYAFERNQMDSGT